MLAKGREAIHAVQAFSHEAKVAGMMKNADVMLLTSRAMTIE